MNKMFVTPDKLKRLLGLVKAFDAIVDVATAANAKDPVSCSDALEEIQEIIKQFGKDYGL